MANEGAAVALTYPFLLSQLVVPGMRARGLGSILFLSSVAASTGGLVGPGPRRRHRHAAR